MHAKSCVYATAAARREGEFMLTRPGLRQRGRRREHSGHTAATRSRATSNECNMEDADGNTHAVHTSEPDPERRTLNFTPPPHTPYHARSNTQEHRKATATGNVQMRVRGGGARYPLPLDLDYPFDFRN